MNMRACVVLAAVILCGGTGRSAADVLERLDLRAVDVGGEVGRRIEATIGNNALVLDLEGDFLKPFEEKAGAGGYVGLGKLIDSLVRFAAYSEDARVIARKQEAVGRIIAAQEADGYLGFFRPERRMWTLWDVHEMAYLLYGLTMDYRFFGEAGSLDAAKKGADYIMKAWEADPEAKPGGGDITVYMAVTGLETALLALHEATGDMRYVDFCTGLRKLGEWDGPLVLGRFGPIQGHAYAYMCRSLAQLRLSRLQKNPALFRPSQKVLDFLLQGDGLSVTGTCGQHECWHDSQDGIANLGETCATAYLLRWLDELMRMEGESLYGDLMERGIHNALWAAQSPDGRKIRYYSPFEGPRVYFDGDTYCCPCNYRRIVAELPQMVFYRRQDGIAVNLYTPAEAQCTLEDGVVVGLKQDTKYPSEGRITIAVNPEQAAEFTLALRIPRWCAKASVAINGEQAGFTCTPGTFCETRREWHPGDVVELNLDMALRFVKGRKAQSGRAAVLWGPLVFCLDPAKNPDVPKEDLRVITMDPATLEGPFPDDSVRPGGVSCTVKAWRTTSWYPHAKYDWTLTLTEFPDPGGEATYFHVPNPNDPALVADELSGLTHEIKGK